MTELELSAECEAAMRRVGNSNVKMRQFNEDWPFGNVSAGPHAGLAGYTGNPLAWGGVSPAIGGGSGWRPIGPGEPVVVDLVAFAGRVPLRPDPRHQRWGLSPPTSPRGSACVWACRTSSGQAARAGAVCGDVYKQADDWMTERLAASGLDAYFMGAPNNQAPYVGHGVGLELDELPVLARGFKMVLEEDQVVACEPKLVFPGRGVVGRGEHLAGDGGRPGEAHRFLRRVRGSLSVPSGGEQSQQSRRSGGSHLGDVHPGFVSILPLIRFS